MGRDRRRRSPMLTPAAPATRCTCGCKLSARRFFPLPVSYQVQKWEQKDPDDIDEMPVQTGDLDGIVISTREFSKPCEQRQNQHDPDSDSHVNRVQPCHRKVNPEK